MKHECESLIVGLWNMLSLRDVMLAKVLRAKMAIWSTYKPLG